MMKSFCIVTISCLAIWSPIFTNSQSIFSANVTSSNISDTITTYSLATATSYCHEIPNCQMFEGHCCQRIDGLFHDCCTDDTNSIMTHNRGYQNTTIASSTIDKNSTVILSTIDDDRHHSSSIVVSKDHRRVLNGPIWRLIRSKCIFNRPCRALGLRGDCCPTSDGIYLNCCKHKPTTCSSYRACTNLTGNCCPTDTGVFLNCCNQIN